MADDTIYSYAVGRVRTIERGLLDRNAFDRMIDSSGPEEVMKMLADAGYGTGEDTVDVWNYEKMLTEEIKKVYHLVSEITPEDLPLKPFRHKWDFHNAKVVLKGEMHETDYDDYLIDIGMIPVELLVSCIRDKDYKKLINGMSEALEDSRDTFNRTGDPQFVDFIMDAAAHRQILKDAKETENMFVIEYFKKHTDLVNIKSFIRVKSMEGTPDFLRRTIFEGGSISIKLFMESLDETLDDFKNKLEYGPYGEMVGKGVDSIVSTGSMSEFEKLSDDYMMEYVSGARYVAVGMEPFIAYLIAMEREIMNARIVLVGKINGLSRDNIRERLRRTYV